MKPRLVAAGPTRSSHCLRKCRRACSAETPAPSPVSLRHFAHPPCSPPLTPPSQLQTGYHWVLMKVFGLVVMLGLLIGTWLPPASADLSVPPHHCAGVTGSVQAYIPMSPSNLQRLTAEARQGWDFLVSQVPDPEETKRLQRALAPFALAAEEPGFESLPARTRLQADALIVRNAVTVITPLGIAHFITWGTRPRYVYVDVPKHFATAEAQVEQLFGEHDRRRLEAIVFTLQTCSGLPGGFRANLKGSALPAPGGARGH